MVRSDPHDMQCRSLKSFSVGTQLFGIVEWCMVEKNHGACCDEARLPLNNLKDIAREYHNSWRSQ